VSTVLHATRAPAVVPTNCHLIKAHAALMTGARARELRMTNTPLHRQAAADVQHDVAQHHLEEALADIQHMYTIWVKRLAGMDVRANQEPMPSRWHKTRYRRTTAALLSTVVQAERVSRWLAVCRLSYQKSATMLANSTLNCSGTKR
jgi:hypothetical protein